MSRPPPQLPGRAAMLAEGEIVRDELFENRRGSCLFGTARFSCYGLLPTAWHLDLPAWSTQGGAPSIDRMSFPVAPGWEWISDWAVDMRGDVDADGWAYATSFRAREFTGMCSQAHYVCRRAWVRTRRRIPGWQPGNSASSASSLALSDSTSVSPNEVLILHIPTLVRACTLDRQKVDAVASSLAQLSAKDVVVPAYSVEAILNELEYDKSRLAAVKLLLPYLDKEGLIAALFHISFHSNRLDLLKSVEPDSFLQSYLVVA
ncbi:hypothetical protein CcCBS67573_g06834 [Chytriomyces confervae]|uniref:Peroxin/Ferlin domain-containing protein n=1 Tax=Chytriomyces confervae TaxID=246404 RepID=A0A507EZU7_9FUNG|nr:hypothetical protein CcCBS67573_g06834 [Chytriomyces confervae]